MPLATKTELLEIVPELRAMAAKSKTATVRETLDLLANRYAAMAAAAACREATPVRLPALPPAPTVARLGGWSGYTARCDKSP
jgi:hypothetical protein